MLYPLVMSYDVNHLVDLAIFARVVESRSFTAAASQSGIAKSAVSRRISLLERRLGVLLLRRTTRTLSVTTEGAHFYEHCAKVLESARAAEASVAGDAKGIRGRIRVSAPVTLSYMHLTRAIAEFLESEPEVEVELVTSDRFVDVVGDGFDLVVRVAQLEDASYVARRLASDRLVVVGSPAYLDARGRPTTPEDLIHHECLHYELVPRAAEWRFRGAAGGAPIPTRGRFSSSCGSSLRSAALASAGLVVIPSHMVAPDVAAGRLEVVLSHAWRGEIGIYGVVATSRGLAPRTRSLLDFLARWFKDVVWANPHGPGSRAPRTTSGTPAKTSSRPRTRARTQAR
jgi:DNA-binding transcriptional LysR family regulator